MIAHDARVSRGWLSDFVGHVDPAKRAAREAQTGIISLLSLGLVRERVLDIDGKKERAYEVTTDALLPARSACVLLQRLRESISIP